MSESPEFHTCWGNVLYTEGFLSLSVLKVKVLSAHDKGSHAEVEVKVQKVLSQNTKVKIQRGRVTLYPESWTARGCTCPILNPGQTHTLLL